MWVQIADRIKGDVAAAMKAGERDRVSALRLVLSELQKAHKDGEGDELAVLRRERKRRREAEAAYRDAGRGDLAEREAFEAQAIEAYLPAELSDAELDRLGLAAIAETGPQGRPGEFAGPQGPPGELAGPEGPPGEFAGPEGRPGDLMARRQMELSN